MQQQQQQQQRGGKTSAHDEATSSETERVAASVSTQQFPPSRCSFQIHQPQRCGLNNKIAQQQHQSSRTQDDREPHCRLDAIHHNLKSRRAQCHHLNDCLLPRADTRLSQIRDHSHHASSKRPLRAPKVPVLLLLLGLCAAALGGGATKAVVAEEIHLHDGVRENSHTREQQQTSFAPLNGGDLHSDQPINCPYHHGINSHKSQQQQQQQQQHHHHHQHHYNQLQSSSSGSTRGRYQLVAAAAASEEPPSQWPPAQAAKEARRRTTGKGQEVVAGAAKAPACDDCLAIPLVALVGDKQINGFIIPPSSSGGRSLQGSPSYRANSHERAQQQQDDTDFTYERPPIQRHRQQQQRAKNYNNHYSFNYKYEPPLELGLVSLEPKSDEKCPMTGYLTVCDHIDSYPTDVILDKLHSAKKQLGKSQFNLDSLFSDERDNSGDPFESLPEMKEVPHPHRRAHPHHHNHNDIDDNNVSPGTRKQANSSGSSYHVYPAAADPNANIYTHLAAASGGQHDRRRTRANKGGYNAADRDTSPSVEGPKPDAGSAWQEQPAMIRPQGQSSNGRGAAATKDSPSSMQDDFVELVERQAISLAPTDRQQQQREEPRPSGSSAAYRPPDTTGSRQPDRLSSSKYQQQQQQSGRIGHPHQWSILTFNRTATDGGGQRQSKTSTKTSSASGRRSLAPAKLKPGSLGDTVAANYDDEKHQPAAAEPDLPATGSAPAETGEDDQSSFESKVYTSEKALAAATSTAASQTRFPYSAGTSISPSPNRHSSPPLAAGSQQQRRRREQQHRQTTNETSLGTGGHTNRSKTRRSRRQATSVRVTASSGGEPMAGTAEVAAPQRNPVMTGTGDGNAGDPADGSGDGSDSDNSSRQPPPPSATDEPTSESSNESQAEPVCRAKSIYISPRAALNDKKQWKYVVNAPERNPQIRQIIRVDICQDPFGPCSDQVSIPFGFTSECKQKYSKKKLLALDAKSGLLEVDTFFIPSCCVCQLIRSNSNLIDEETTSPLQQQPPAAEIDTPNLPPSPITTITPSSAISGLDNENASA